MLPNNSVAKPYLKKMARLVLYYIHFTLLLELAAVSSLPLLPADAALLTPATALSLG